MMMMIIIIIIIIIITIIFIIIIIVVILRFFSSSNCDPFELQVTHPCKLSPPPFHRLSSRINLSVFKRAIQFFSQYRLCFNPLSLHPLVLPSMKNTRKPCLTVLSLFPDKLNFSILLQHAFPRYELTCSLLAFRC